MYSAMDVVEHICYHVIGAEWGRDDTVNYYILLSQDSMEYELLNGSISRRHVISLYEKRK